METVKRLYRRFSTGSSVSDARYMVVHEALKKERIYTEVLQKLSDVYAEPLRKTESLNNLEYAILFSDIQPLLSLSSDIIAKLEKCICSWCGSCSILGKIFDYDFMILYNSYVEKFPLIQRVLNEKLNEDSNFSAFCHSANSSSNDTLERLLSEPVQRISDYQTLLREVVEESPESHPDYNELSRALDRIKELLREKEDDRIDKQDNEGAMLQLQEKFPHDDLQITEDDSNLKIPPAPTRRKSAPGAMLFRNLGSNKLRHTTNLSAIHKQDVVHIAKLSSRSQRSYVLEGPVQITAGLQTYERYLFLLSDLLLVAKAKSSSAFKLKHRIRACELWLSSCIDEVAEVTRPEANSFVIGWPTTNVVVTFSTASLKDIWLENLKRIIDAEKQKEDPKELNIRIHNKELGEMKTIGINSSQTSCDVIEICVLKSPLMNQAADYQLWVSSGKEEAAYPLIGHEYPFAIQMSHIRDVIKLRELERVPTSDYTQLLFEAPPDYQCKFFIRNCKMKKHLYDAQQYKIKKGKRSPLLNIFKRNFSRDDKTSPVLSLNYEGKLFGKPLQEVMIDKVLPKQIMDLLSLMFVNGPMTENILRKPANEKLKRELRQRLDNEEDCLDENTSPLILGTLLKDYLRSIPNSLLLADLYSDWIAVSEIDDIAPKIDFIKQLLSRLPECNVELLRYVICLLYHVALQMNFNHMNAFNLSVCIGPSLLWPADPQNIGATQNISSVNKIVEFMINYPTEIFGPDVLLLLGEVPNYKFNPEMSGTDSDSIHSVPDTSQYNHDDSSVDSLNNELCDNGHEHINDLPKNPLSQSSLSHDSGLMMSDSHLNVEEGDSDPSSRTLSNFEHQEARENSYLFEDDSSLIVPRTGLRKNYRPYSSIEYSDNIYNQIPHDISQSVSSLRYSDDSLDKYSEESLEDNSTFKPSNNRQNAGPRVFYGESPKLNLSKRKIGRDHFRRQKSTTDVTPPHSPDYKKSYSSDSLFSESSLSRNSIECSNSLSPNVCAARSDKLPAWLPTEDEEKLVESLTEAPHCDSSVLISKSAVDNLSELVSSSVNSTVFSTANVTSCPVTLTEPQLPSQSLYKHLQSRVNQLSHPRAADDSSSIFYSPSCNSDCAIVNANEYNSHVNKMKIRKLKALSDNVSLDDKQSDNFSLSDKSSLQINTIVNSNEINTGSFRTSTGHDAKDLVFYNDNNNNSCSSSCKNSSRTKKISKTTIPLLVPINPRVTTDTITRPSKPPSYGEAVKRNYYLKHGISLDGTKFTELQRIAQKKNSEKAKRLYNDSVKVYHQSTQNDRYSLTHNPSCRSNVKVISPNHLATSHISNTAKTSPVQCCNSKQTYEAIRNRSGSRNDGERVRTTARVMVGNSVTCTRSHVNLNRSLSDADDQLKSLSKRSVPNDSIVKDQRLINERRRIENQIRENSSLGERLKMRQRFATPRQKHPAHEAGVGNGDPDSNVGGNTSDNCDSIVPRVKDISYKTEYHGRDQHPSRVISSSSLPWSVSRLKNVFDHSQNTNVTHSTSSSSDVYSLNTSKLSIQNESRKNPPLTVKCYIQNDENELLV